MLAFLVVAFTVAATPGIGVRFSAELVTIGVVADGALSDGPIVVARALDQAAVARRDDLAVPVRMSVGRDAIGLFTTLPDGRVVESSTRRKVPASSSAPRFGGGGGGGNVFACLFGLAAATAVLGLEEAARRKPRPVDDIEGLQEAIAAAARDHIVALREAQAPVRVVYDLQRLDMPGPLTTKVRALRALQGAGAPAPDAPPATASVTFEHAEGRAWVIWTTTLPDGRAISTRFDGSDDDDGRVRAAWRHARDVREAIATPGL